MKKRVLKVRIWNSPQRSVRVQPTSQSINDHEENALALLVFLNERVPHMTMNAFGILINRQIRKHHFQTTIREAYMDVFPPAPPAPKYKTVEIDADMLDAIKYYCPRAIKE